MAYIAKFTSLNMFFFGTYVDGLEDVVLNDVVVLGNSPTGRVSFVGQVYCGSVADQDGDCSDDSFPALVNGFGATADFVTAPTNSSQAFVGTLNGTGTAFDMLARIGGSFDDAFHAILELNGRLYVGGRTNSANLDLEIPDDAGFVPAYAVKNTDFDAVVGWLLPDGAAAGGTWHATFYGGTGIDLVNCLSAFLDGVFLYGSTTSPGMSLPTQDIGVGGFFNDTFQGGDTPPIDIFFATFEGALQQQIFGTYIGGPRNDYLGQTGDPRGSNHMFSNNSNLWLGTTIHSGDGNATNNATLPTNVLPEIISAGSFDPDKSSIDGIGTDVHVIFRLGGAGAQLTLLKAVQGAGP